MPWLILYVVGVPIMFAFLANRLGEYHPEEHDMSRGRILMSLLWPIFLPVILIKMMQTEVEDRKSRMRSEEWKRKARGEN